MVAPPGDRADYIAREPLSLWAGGDEGSTAAVSCTESAGVLSLVATTGYHPVEGEGADIRNVHETTLVLDAGMIRIVDTRDWTEPASSDPPWWPGAKTCGVDFEPFR
jgi:hypothetical protein